MKAVLKQKVYDRFLAVVVFWKVNGEMFVLNEVSKTKTHTHKKNPRPSRIPREILSTGIAVLFLFRDIGFHFFCFFYDAAV